MGILGVLPALAVLPLAWQVVRSQHDRTEATALAAAASERRRLAHELHDVVGHRITVIAFQARQLEGDGVDRDDQDTGRLIRELAQQASDDIRRIVRPRMEAADSPRGLLSAEIAEAAALLPSGRATVSLVNVDRERPMTSAQRLTAVRVFQEGVSNALRHGVGPIQARLDFAGDLVISVTNAMPPCYPGVPPGSGAGLAGMRERLAALGGRLDSGPTSGQRFRLQATIPVPPAVTRARPSAGPAGGAFPRLRPAN